MRYWKDTVYGYRAQASSRITAFMLIRNKCHEMKQEPPTLDQVIAEIADN